MMTKQNVSLKDEPIIGLNATKAADWDYDGVQNELLWTWSKLSKSLITYILSIGHRRQQRKTKEEEKAKAKDLKFKEKRQGERSRWEASEVEKGRGRDMMQWEKKCLTLMKVERKNMMDSKQAIWWRLSRKQIDKIWKVETIWSTWETRRYM